MSSVIQPLVKNSEEVVCCQQEEKQAIGSRKDVVVLNSVDSIIFFNLMEISFPMPIYMDLHVVPGVKARGVAEAHQMDVLIEEEYGCKCMTYWVDEGRGQVFCLIEAPNKEAVVEMHGKAHGLMPHKIIEVQTSVVESFLGRVNDPEGSEPADDGLKLISDPSFRIVTVIRMIDPVLLAHQLGSEKAAVMINQANQVVRQELLNHGGTEVEHKGAGFIASFTSACKALACARAIDRQLSDKDNNLGLRISINAGQPVANNDALFGDTIKLADRMCFIAQNSQPYISSSVKELVGIEQWPDSTTTTGALSSADENFLDLLFTVLENHWHDAGFTMDEYYRLMAMSQSRVYRKTIALTGLSPNELLKQYRLDKAREIVKKGQYTISEICFDTGFTSPSYFTKCFKKQYGIQPMAYHDLVY